MDCLGKSTCGGCDPDCQANINIRDLAYSFLNLAYLKQYEILLKLNLLDNFKFGNKFGSVIHKIIQKAEDTNCLWQLWEEVQNGHKI